VDSFFGKIMASQNAMWLVIDKTKGNINYKFDMVIAAKINQYV
jgi:hypothetical protein